VRLRHLRAIARRIYRPGNPVGTAVRAPQPKICDETLPHALS
jgi:hypothetical protein